MSLYVLIESVGSSYLSCFLFLCPLVSFGVIDFSTG